MTTDLKRCTGAGIHWRLGAYDFRHYPGVGLRHGWCCAVRGRGAGNHSSPLAAFRALRRWLRDEPADESTPASPTP